MKQQRSAPARDEKSGQARGGKTAEKVPMRRPRKTMSLGESKEKKKIPRKEASKAAEPVPTPTLAPGACLESKRHGWIIDTVLGAGGFGCVYKVHERSNSNVFFALKTERRDGQRKEMMRLKIEAVLLLEIRQSENKEHFVEVLDRGQTPNFKFLVMTLVGKSLHDVRKRLKEQKFSMRSALHICYQSSAALNDLHNIGWIHRDLKLPNFAIGLENRERIYLIDFGCAKKIPLRYDCEGTKARTNRFLGTADTASIAALTGHFQSYKDDFESLIYMMFDAFDPECCPWKNCAITSTGVLHEVAKMKKRFMDGNLPESSNVPRNLKELVTHVGGKRAQDKVEYPLFVNHLDKAVEAENVDMSQPLDWIGIDLDKEISKKETPAAAAE